MSEQSDAEDIVDKTSSSEYFDQIIGHIEDIVLCQEFQTLHNKFLKSHWSKFEKGPENKLEYMDIFSKYTVLFENYLNRELTNRMSNFNMQRFAMELDQNNSFNGSINNGEIFELLDTFGNFQTFKELMLDFRNKMEDTSDDNFDFLTTTKFDINP